MGQGKRKYLRLAFALILGVPATVLFLASLLRPPAGETSGFIDPVLSALCHRIPSRCLSTPWGVTGLCGRCTFFWFGLAAGSFVLYHRQVVIPLPAGVILVLTMIADGLMQNIGLYDSAILRLATGLAAGTGIAAIFLGGGRNRLENSTDT